MKLQKQNKLYAKRKNLFLLIADKIILLIERNIYYNAKKLLLQIKNLKNYITL